MAVPASSGALPSTVAPSLKVTVPEGTPLEELTTEVKVTELPTVDGFVLDPMLAIDAYLFICVKTGELTPP